jgi:hypothetical protein
MTPEERQLLEETHELAQENNKKLRTIERQARFAFWWGIIKIAFWLGLLYYGWLAVQPFVERALATYESIADKTGSLDAGFSLDGLDLEKFGEILQNR